MTKAAEEEMQDTMLYDGDQQRYLRLLANGGEEEVGIDASDVDSSDVASSNDVDSDSDADSDIGGSGGGRDSPLRSSVARSAGRGKRGRAQMGTPLDGKGGAGAASDPNPLLAEIATKSERRQAASQRWFSDPIFNEVDETLAASVEPGQQQQQQEEESADDDDVMEDAPGAVEKPSSATRPRRGGDEEKGRRRVQGGGEEKGRRRVQGEDGVGEGQGGQELGAADALLAAMPKTEKEKRKEKRKKAAERKERKETKNSRRMGEDGIPDNDLQVVSGERDLENLDRKERAKLEKKRGLIRAGMGAVADEEEDTGFEVAKANSMAMAMLGKRPRPSFAVEGLEIEDERQYGSDQARGHK